MIQDVAEKQGNINVDVVTDALKNSNQRIMGPRYMKAGMGDGGACHPRDNIALRWMSDNLELVMTSLTRSWKQERFKQRTLPRNSLNLVCP